MPERDVEITGMVLLNMQPAEAGAYVNSGLISPFLRGADRGRHGRHDRIGVAEERSRCPDDPTDQVGVVLLHMRPGGGHQAIDMAGQGIPDEIARGDLPFPGRADHAKSFSLHHGYRENCTASSP